MHPKQALEVHKDVFASMTRPGMARLLTGYMEDVYRKKTGPVVVDESGKPSGAAFATNERYRLGVSETFYVSADMLALANFAADGLDQLDRFAHDLWPVDNGFLVFDDVMVETDVWGVKQAVKAISWGRKADPRTGASGTFVVSYADTRDPRDEVTQQQRVRLGQESLEQVLHSTGRYHVSQVSWIGDDQHVGPEVQKTDPAYQAYAEEGQVALATTRNGKRTLMALLMLMNQTVASKTRHDLMPTKAVHARRMPIPAQVTVITLRREAGAGREHGESQVQWAHRWMVRGFWRSQSCGPDYPMAVEVQPGVYRARIWINPYVKGPAGAPMKQSTKVYALTR